MGSRLCFGPIGFGQDDVLRCVSGLEHLAGELAVGGEVWQDGDGFSVTALRRPIGYVSRNQSFSAPIGTKESDVRTCRALKAGTAAQIRLDDVVDLMGIASLLDRTTTTLSGGERQRAAIGRALLSQPRLLLMDEPLSSLDQRNKEEILPYFEALHDTLSIPILYVSHDISEVERLADTLVLLDKGTVIACGPLADLLPDGRLPIARRAGAATVVEAVVKAFDSTYGLTEMDVNGETLLVPGRIAEMGKTRRIRIAAADVSLAPDRPSQTSILNVIPAVVKEIHPLDDAQVNVVLSESGIARPEPDCWPVSRDVRVRRSASPRGRMFMPRSRRYR